MRLTRRDFLHQITLLTGSVLGMAISAKASTNAWLANGFRKQKFEQTLTELFPTTEIQYSDRIHLKLPKVAENGAVVPITITSTIDGIDTVYIFAEKNPVPLIAKFTLNPALEPFIGARFKMKESCDVIVIVKAKDQLYQTRQRVKVTLAGCGG